VDECGEMSLARDDVAWPDQTADGAMVDG